MPPRQKPGKSDQDVQTPPDLLRAFAKSHQLEEAWNAASYAAVVHLARDHRVRKILEAARNAKP